MDNAHIRKIFETDSEDFEQKALAIFDFQYEYNPLYRAYVNLVADRSKITKLTDIPFLPISFFKSHAVTTTAFEEVIIFKSSGTTAGTTSRHLVKDLSIYQASYLKGFEALYGPVEAYCILALLPSYLEQGASSLVNMVQGMMDKSRHPENGFYLHNWKELAQALHRLEAQGQKTLLIGVTYALLDFAAAFPMPLKYTLVMETGGMKGRRKELLRGDVHEWLRQAFGLPQIHSEYGMTELLSQAYAKKEGRFFTPPWMKVGVGEEDDPGRVVFETEKPLAGVLHIIDLANVYSCSFIATQDISRLHPDLSFEVMGRLDHSDIRGCSLLAL